MNNLKLFIGNVEQPLTISRFPGGEMYVRIDGEQVNPWFVCKIVANIRCSDDVMSLVMLEDAIDKLWQGCSIDLVIPYLPYARQDKIFSKGESDSLTIFLKLLNSLHDVDSITVYDLHSDLGLAKASTGGYSFTSVHQKEFVKNVKIPGFHNKFVTLCAPDEGSRVKIKEVAEAFGSDNIIYGEKHRDHSQQYSQVTSTSISDPGGCLNHDCPILIVDDICDGGRTFIELAKKIREKTSPEQEIYLYVTHGIFSKTLAPLINAGIKHIFTANPFAEHVNDELVTIVDYK